MEQRTLLLQFEKIDRDANAEITQGLLKAMMKKVYIPWHCHL